MIYDLHCDLLGSVADKPDTLTLHSPETRCSVPQLRAGGVALQTFAVATIGGPNSSKQAEKQIALYQKLQQELAPIRGLIAIENASGLADEGEPLESAFHRLDTFSQVEQILYISLTWNGENRFGGGNKTDVGLKPDGKALLAYISGKGIAIDLSHTSDPLAYDILNTLDRENLHIPVIASHSNYRAIEDHPRNLPDELALEVIRRKGVIGLNLVRRFLGKQKGAIITHVEHALKLGGENTIALGADYYGGFDMPPELVKELWTPTFSPGLDNSSCYPALFALLRDHFTEAQLERLAYQNVEGFLEGVR
ncbi:MAG: dipeptidase [Parachlamydiales bacterium]